MPRSPQGRAALTDAERQARRRDRKAARDRRWLEALKSIAYSNPKATEARAIARAALEEGTPK